MLMSKTPAELLTKALERFEGGYRWGKGNLYPSRNHKGVRPDGPTPDDPQGYSCYCSLGAIESFTPEYGIKLKAQKYLGDAIRQLKPFNNYGIANFNDSPKTTFDDIQQVFTKAIELAHQAGD